MGLRKNRLIVFVLITFLLSLSLVLASKAVSDKIEIQKNINIITKAVNDNNFTVINNLISPEAKPYLMPGIKKELSGKKINFRQEILSYDYIHKNKIKVRCIFFAKGQGWNISGLPNYYIFQKDNGHWLLTDSNFYKMLDGSYIFKSIGKIILYIILFSIPFTAFWIWMLIDVLRKEFDDKLVWTIVIILTGFIGAVIYYFVVKRHTKIQK